jgi:osomolarity two-component system response regulator SSK1
MVDDVRDLILRKFANSIGRHFDAPDLNLHITPRDKTQARPLKPDEILCKVLDSYYPEGQTVDDALTISVPQPQPRPSPRSAAHYAGMAHYPPEANLPVQEAEEYFPPTGAPSAPLLPQAGIGNDLIPHATPTLSTAGQAPPLPSPNTGRAQAFTDRPRLGRSHTTSPAIPGNPNVALNPDGMFHPTLMSFYLLCPSDSDYTSTDRSTRIGCLLHVTYPCSYCYGHLHDHAGFNSTTPCAVTTRDHEEA